MGGLFYVGVSNGGVGLDMVIRGGREHGLCGDAAEGSMSSANVGKV